MKNYVAAAYARVSRDDANGTIDNQLSLIHDFAKTAPEIRIDSEWSDVGFSGVNFLRPQFTEMMREIETGGINCVIVKDLSRLGRNYIEVGELIGDVFPRLGVRLIAVNDQYDSLYPRVDLDEILIPFKNLINEQYLRDFSVKIRSNLNIRRQNGDFVASFAAYGYKRAETDKHKLVVDEHAAAIVREIFRMKIQGTSNQRIADRLNEWGEPSPAEYKTRNTNYRAAFRTHDRARWSAVAVGRVLQNPVYVGTLVQGKSSTLNYKLKKRIQKPRDEWHVVPNAHEPIIDRRDFETVNGILRQDTRTPPRSETVFPLGGILFCGDCGHNMTRKKAGKYGYYVCAAHKAGIGRPSRCFDHKKLENAVASALFTLIKLAAHDVFLHETFNAERLKRQIADREKEISACENFRRSLFADYKSGVISKEDCAELREDYDGRIAELQKAIERLNAEGERPLTEPLKIDEVSRPLAVILIERIDAYGGKRVVIRLRYRDPFRVLDPPRSKSALADVRPAAFAAAQNFCPTETSSGPVAPTQEIAPQGRFAQGFPQQT